MRREVLLPLYGRVNLDGPAWDLAWDLLQTDRAQRLHDISLSSTPARYVAAGMPASRFQHSIGVMLVADRIASAHKQWHALRDTLIAAAISHDLASPPSSHVAEGIFAGRSGLTHEQEAAELICTDEEFSGVLARYGVDPTLVGQAITGTHPVLGPLIAGDLDADSIDNSLHLLRALSGSHGSVGAYQPFEIADLFEPGEDGRPQLHVDFEGLRRLLAWRQVRIDLYALLGSEAHLSATASLLRAFALSPHLLTEQWAAMGEHEALLVMEREGSAETRALLGRLAKWKHLHCVAHLERAEPGSDGWAALPGDMELRVAVEDELAAALDLPRHEVAVYAGYSRRTKQIKLPMVGEAAPAAREVFGPDQPKLFRVVAFAPGHLQVDQQQIVSLLDDAVERLGAGRAARKTFF